MSFFYDGTKSGVGRPSNFPPVPIGIANARPMTVEELNHHIKYHKGGTYYCHMLQNNQRPNLPFIAVPIAKPKLVGFIEALYRNCRIPFIACIENGNLCVFINEVVTNIQNNMLQSQHAQDIWIPGASHTTTQHQDPSPTEQPQATQPVEPLAEPDFMAFPTLIEAKKALIAFKWPDLMMHWHYLTEITLDEDDPDLMGILYKSQLDELIALEDLWYATKTAEEANKQPDLWND